MSRATYLRAQATAKRLIEQYGQPLVVRSEDVSGGYDSNGDPLPPQPSVEISGSGVKLDYTISEKESSAIQAGDAKLLFSTTGSPQVGMLVEIDGEDWRIIQPNPLQPAGVIVMYSMQVRR